MTGQAVNDQSWIRGADSLADPVSLQPGSYQWAENVLNRGGIISTRPGFRIIGTMIADLGEPQGVAIFNPLSHPANTQTQIILAIGGKIVISRFPYLTYSIIPSLQFSAKAPRIVFKTARQTVKEDESGVISFLDESKPTLMIQDGMGTRCGYWDGWSGGHLDPTQAPNAYGPPSGLWMEWIGSRLWVAVGDRLYAGNEGNPLKFTENGYTAQGGFLHLPGDITGLGATPDQRSLLAGTLSSVSSVQASILDRTQWAQTTDFQKVILPGIGIASGFSFYNQYGLTWWYSTRGLIGLDNALQTYRSSRIHFRDQQMMRSKSNLNRDLSCVAVGGFENFLMVSVPSGDRYNAHTWVMDQAPMETLEGTGGATWAAVWRGVRPVQWITGIVNGEERCFFLSRDYKPNKDGTYTKGKFVVNLWEAFVPECVESGHNFASKRIDCSFETRYLGIQQLVKKFAYLRLDLTEISRTVDIEAFVCGLRGGYVSVLKKRIVATTGLIGSAFAAQIDKDTIIQALRPQDRLIRSTEVKSGNTTQAGIESKDSDDIDRFFSILVRWTGKMAIRSIQIYLSDRADKETFRGKCEEDEGNQQMITLAGAGATSTVAATDNPALFSRGSRYFLPNTPRCLELPYYSLTFEMLKPEIVIPISTIAALAPNIPIKPAGNRTVWVDPPAPDPLPPDTPPPGDDNPPDRTPVIDRNPPRWPPVYIPPYLP